MGTQKNKPKYSPKLMDDAIRFLMNPGKTKKKVTIALAASTFHVNYSTLRRRWMKA